jgi:two-component system cell cycle sensor histidine kinase/response regulator CckA
VNDNIRDSNEQFRFLADAIPHLVWMMQPDGAIDYFNERCLAYTGCTFEELVGWGWGRVIHPDDYPLKMQLYRQAIENGTEFRHEYRIRRYDGQYRWHQGSAVPYRDEAGIIRRWYGTCTDVDELKQTENALRASQERLQAIVSNVPVILFATDKEGTYILAEGKGLEAVGRVPGELVGMSVFGFEQEYPDLVEHIRRALAGETVQWLAAIDDIVYDSHCSPIRDADGELAGVIGVAIDVTERMRQEQERQYMMDAAHCLLWYADVYDTGHPDYLGWDIHITDEEAAQRFLPLELQEGEAYKDAKYRCRLPEDRVECDHLATTSIRAGQSYTQEFRCRTLDGSIHWLREDMQVETVEPHKHWRVVAVCTDITDRKRLEAQVLQAQKMDGIGRLAGGIAHDFNNLLSVILGYAEMVEMELADDSDLLSNVHNIQNAATRAAKLTSQLLAFARRQVSAARVLQPNALIAGMRPILKPLIREDIELVMKLNDAAGSLKADPTQIEQILINLVVNARDAMPGGGKIVIETERVVLADHHLREHTTVAAGEYVMIAVSDTGVGMSPEVKSRLFEPFFTTKGVGKGTGLGLATVYGIVKQHGGYVFAYSEPGIGTTMKVYLPRVAEAAPAVEGREQRPQTEPGGTETLLVAEDEQLVRELTVTTLRRHGYTVLEAADGAEALRIAADYAGEIHLVVSDAIMPVMNGKELANRIKAVRPSTRFLYVSGYTAEVTSSQGILPEGTAFLQKPFTANGLLNAVRSVLDAT